MEVAHDSLHTLQIAHSVVISKFINIVCFNNLRNEALDYPVSLEFLRNLSRFLDSGLSHRSSSVGKVGKEN